MLGGSLARYHTPSMPGKGLTHDLVKLAGPTLMKSIGNGLEPYGKGASFDDALSSSGKILKKGIKRKLPAATGAIDKSAVKQGNKKKVKRVRDLFDV